MLLFGAKYHSSPSEMLFLLYYKGAFGEFCSMYIWSKYVYDIMYC